MENKMLETSTLAGLLLVVGVLAAIILGMFFAVRQSPHIEFRHTVTVVNESNVRFYAESRWGRRAVEIGTTERIHWLPHRNTRNTIDLRGWCPEQDITMDLVLLFDMCASRRLTFYDTRYRLWRAFDTHVKHHTYLTAEVDVRINWRGNVFITVTENPDAITTS
ncbi:MAG: hypothetical protein FWC79_07575 [Oscillospiraceae bacterium]|nr:hypothetical protein [Oscillospiraceae bacterium]